MIQSTGLDCFGVLASRENGNTMICCGVKAGVFTRGEKHDMICCNRVEARPKAASKQDKIGSEDGAFEEGRADVQLPGG